MDELKHQTLTIQNNIENLLDEQLPNIGSKYETMTNEINNLYIKVSEINPNETIHYREYIELLKTVNKSNKFMYLLLLAELLRLGYIKREVLLLIGLHNIMVKHGLFLETFFDNYFTGVARNIFEYDILKKKYS